MKERYSPYKRWKLGLPELGTSHYGINEEGHLTIRARDKEYDVYKLAEEQDVKTLEMFVPDVVEKNVKILKMAFDDARREYQYSGEFYHCYPMKSSTLGPTINAVLRAGAHIETGAWRELALAKYNLTSMLKDRLIPCNGPKDENYLKAMCDMVSEGYKVIPVVEDDTELENLTRYAQEYKFDKLDIGLRMSPELSIKSHWNCEIFGVLQCNVVNFYKRHIANNPKLNLVMLHNHVSSQTELLSDTIRISDNISNVFADLGRAGAPLKYLNLGGGLAIPYDKKAPHYSLTDFARAIISEISENLNLQNLTQPNIIVEAGRWTVAPAQLTVFTANYVKQNGNYQQIVLDDGSFMTDLPDVWGVKGQKFWHVPVNGLHQEKLASYRIRGSLCDSDDIYPWRLKLPVMNKCGYIYGEKAKIAFLDTGAYQDQIVGFGTTMNHSGRTNAKKIILDGGIETLIEEPSIAELAKILGYKTFNQQI